MTSSHSLSPLNAIADEALGLPAAAAQPAAPAACAESPRAR